MLIGNLLLFYISENENYIKPGFTSIKKLKQISKGF